MQVDDDDVEHEQADRRATLPAVEQAKAAQEKWKAVQKGLELTERTGEFLGKAFGPAVDAVGGLLGDQLRYWRAKNLDRLAEKWCNHLTARGVDPVTARSLPFGEAYRVLEAASMEEDEDVQDLWARLLASAMDPARQTGIKKFYIDLLKSFGPAEAAFIDLLWFINSDLTRVTLHEANQIGARFEAFAGQRWATFRIEEQKAAIQNLIRLRCVAYNPRTPMLSRLFRVEPSGAGRRIEIDPREFQRLLKHLDDILTVSYGLRDSKVGQETDHARRARGIGQPLDLTARYPELLFALTPMGRDLMKACSAPSSATKTPL
jgi:Abortive infection alpha